MKNYITDEMMEQIASYMDDQKREEVHFSMAPCGNAEFIRVYLELDQEFAQLLENEFSVDYENMKELKDLTVEEIEQADGEKLTIDELNILKENPAVEKTESLGTRGSYTGCTWYDVQLTNGNSIDIYIK